VGEREKEREREGMKGEQRGRRIRGDHVLNPLI